MLRNYTTAHEYIPLNGVCYLHFSDTFLASRARLFKAWFVSVTKSLVEDLLSPTVLTTSSFAIYFVEKL